MRSSDLKFQISEKKNNLRFEISDLREKKKLGFEISDFRQ
jgi:hypothetical protein